MSNFVPQKVYLRGILLHYFFQKKSAAEAQRILVDTYGVHALSETTCRDWFRRFKNNDYDIEDKERVGGPKKFKNEELKALLSKDARQTQAELAERLGVSQTSISRRLKAIGKVQKERNLLCGHKEQNVRVKQTKENDGEGNNGEVEVTQEPKVIDENIGNPSNKRPKHTKTNFKSRQLKSTIK